MPPGFVISRGQRKIGKILIGLQAYRQFLHKLCFSQTSFGLQLEAESSEQTCNFRHGRIQVDLRGDGGIMIAMIAVIFRKRDETHDVFLGLKSRDELGKKTMRQPLPIPACRQQLQKTLLLWKPGSFQGAVSSEHRGHSAFGTNCPARQQSVHGVMAARSIKTENMKFSMLAVLTSWKTCNAHVDQIAAVFSLNKNNRQFERQLSRV